MLRHMTSLRIAIVWEERVEYSAETDVIAHDVEVMVYHYAQ